MSAKADTVTGAVSVAIFGISATLTPETATAWGNVIIGIAPAILILFLIWRIHKVDKQHEECARQWARTQKQLILAYQTLRELSSCELPSEREFIQGEFHVTPHQRAGD